MKRLIITLTALSFLLPLTMRAQTQTAKVGSKVSQVEIRNSNDDPIKLPYFGEKHILIFYVDPDKAGQNQKFTDHLEENQINSDNIYSFGVINLKDAPMLANSLVRKIARKKEIKTGATIYTDPNHLLRDAWGLGDVNNLFTIIFVTSDGEIAFLKKGAMTQSDIEEFNRVIEKYK